MSNETLASPALDVDRTTGAADVLTQLKPFNDFRLRECVAFLAQATGQNLTPLQIVRLSILIDVSHLLRCGKPVVGGSLAAWQLGPVVPEAYALCRAWESDHDHFGIQPDRLLIVPQGDGRGFGVSNLEPVDPDEFSGSEVAAMMWAWGEIGHLNHLGLTRYMQSPETFLGAAYAAARAADRPMGWDEVLACYDRTRGEDHSAMRRLIAS